MFLPNVPGAMFIPGGTFSPNSRVDLLNAFKLMYFHRNVNGNEDESCVTSTRTSRKLLQKPQFEFSSDEILLKRTFV